VQVFNKIDVLGEGPRLERDETGRPSRVWLSAQTGVGLDLLKDCLHELFGQAPWRFDVTLGPADGRIHARLHALGVVQAEAAAEDGGWHLTVEMPSMDLEALCRREGLDFGQRVSPCLPQGQFVESPRAIASSAA
jgi:GTP-binding protein HflX